MVMKRYNQFDNMFKKAIDEEHARYIYFANVELLKPYEVPDFDAAYSFLIFCFCRQRDIALEPLVSACSAS